MVRPTAPTWIDATVAVVEISAALSQQPHEVEDLFRKALRDGDIRSRHRRHRPNGALEASGTEVDADFWLNRDPTSRRDIDGVVEVHRRSLFDWLSPKQKVAGPGPGRPRELDWEAMWVEVVLIANTPDGLPATQSELANRMHRWFEDRPGRVPHVRDIEKKLEPVYGRKRGN